MTKSTVHSFAKISSKVLALAALAKNPFARDSSKMLNYFFELEGQIPETYHWKFTPTAALIDRLTAIEDHAIWNDIYWRDIAENIQAFSILSYKRTAAILKPAIRALNTDEFLATAILARSALELAAWSLYHTTSFRGTIAAIPTHLSPDSTRFTANGLQTQLVKVLWGTRLETEVDELKQVNILNVIDKLAKKDVSNYLKPTYAYLCEATHPNVVGNAEFWEYPESPTTSQPFTVKIGSLKKSGIPNELLECTLGALGWAGASVRKGMLEARNSIELIGKRFAIKRDL